MPAYLYFAKDHMLHVKEGLPQVEARLSAAVAEGRMARFTDPGDESTFLVNPALVRYVQPEAEDGPSIEAF